MTDALTDPRPLKSDARREADRAPHDARARAYARPPRAVPGRTVILAHARCSSERPAPWRKRRHRAARASAFSSGLALFNRFGEPHVTTADIADEMNISPGNLYYHFRNKDDIIGELYAAFEADVAPLLVAPADRAPQVDDLWFLLHLLFERMWAYRFLYRDLDEITSRNRKVAQRFALLTRRGQDTVIELCRGLVATGTMRATEREIDALASNVVIVATYWMSFRRLVAGPAAGAASDATSDAEPGFAAYQVLALIAPYLRGADRALIERLGADYLR